MVGIGGKVQQTSNYKLFKPLAGNRPVEQRRIDKLVKSIGSIGQLVPIVVNEKNEIVDGQARIAALEKLNMPIAYIVMPGYGPKECREMNSSQTGWTAASYIKSYADLGVSSYIYLQSLTREYDLPMNAILSSVSPLVNKRMGPLGIKSGEFSMTADEYEEARRVLDYVSQFTPEIRNVKGRLEYYYMAIIVCYRNMPAVDNAKLLRSVQTYGYKLGAVDCIDAAMGELEQVYNYRNPTKVFLQGEYRRYVSENQARRKR